MVAFVSPPQKPRSDIVHERFGSSSDPSINGNLHHPNDVDRSLNESDTNKMRKYRSDYNNNPPNSISFIPSIPSTSGRLHSEFVWLLSILTRSLGNWPLFSGVHLTETNSGLFHFRHTEFSSPLKTKVGSTLTKSVSLRLNLNIDGTPITSRTHTHPSHSQTSRLSTSSLSLGVPVPRRTQCIRGVQIPHL